MSDQSYILGLPSVIVSLLNVSSLLSRQAVIRLDSADLLDDINLADVRITEIVRYGCRRILPRYDGTLTYGLCTCAVASGNLEILEYLYDHLTIEVVRPISWYCMHLAISHNYLDIADYIQSKGESVNLISLHVAIREGSIATVKYCLPHVTNISGIECLLACEEGHLDILKYLRDQGCSWNEECCIKAAENGRLEILQYLHANKCPWNIEDCVKIATPEVREWLESQ